jgi:glycosyltransferase involved in cell wall biosynthesis
MCALTIIIPVYNSEAFLEKGFSHLRSLYISKISFEIIYVNDGSTDNSLKVLQEIAAENDFIQVISQDNQGSSGARNTAIEVAQGKYIYFLDSDDALETDKLMVLLAEAQAASLDLLGFRLDYVDESYSYLTTREKQPVPHNQLMSGFECLVYGYQPSSICLFLFKRILLIENELRIYPKITHMDVEFMSRVMLCAAKVKFQNVVVLHYVQRAGSITKPQTKKKLEKLKIDEVTVAQLIKTSLATYGISERAVIRAVRANYNTVVWNLLFGFIARPKESELDVKLKCMELLKTHQLYPIRGPLKSLFQNMTRILMNSAFFLFVVKRMSWNASEVRTHE